MLRLLLLCAFSSVAAAADFIGVTAAVEGQVTRISSTSGAPTGPIESGTQVFEGDVLSVSDGGRAQVMLKDQTTFTLGSGAEMKIDEFVFGTANDSLNANITKGAFRFVSGKIAKTGPDAMTVDLPSAVIGVRGTQVAGLLDANGEGDVVLIGPGPNSFGVTPGAITVANDFGTQDVLRGGFAVGISPNTAPTAPVPAPAELLERVEQAVQELAGEEIAEEVAAELADPQTVALLEALVEAGVEGPDDATNSVDVLAVVLGEDVAAEASEFGVGFTGEALYLLAQYADLTELAQSPPAGPTQSELANSGLVGRYRYTANNIAMTLTSGGGSGSFDSITTLDFDQNELTSNVSGSVTDIAFSGGATASFDFGFNETTPLASLMDGQDSVTYGTFASTDRVDPNTPGSAVNSSIDTINAPSGNLDLYEITVDQNLSQTEQNMMTNTFAGQLVDVTNFNTTNGAIAANDSMEISVSGGFATLNDEVANIGYTNVSIITNDLSASGDPTITNLGGTGVSVRTPE